MFPREASGRVSGAVARLVVLIAMLSIANSLHIQPKQFQLQEPVQSLWQSFPLSAPLAAPPRLADDYVSGVLSLKESLLKKPVAGGYRSGMKSLPQMGEKSQQQQQKKDENVASFARLMPSRLSYESLKKLMDMPAVVEAIAQQLQQDEFLQQVPFMNPSVKENEQITQEEFRQQRTVQTNYQTQLLQQLQQLFGMRPKYQPELNGAASSCTAAPDISVDSEECQTDFPEEAETTEEPTDGEKVIVDVKPAKPDKNKEKAKTTTPKPKKKTTKKLSCCTKPSKEKSGKMPIRFSLNFQNEQSQEDEEQSQETEEHEQQPRTGRHVYNPDLYFDAFANRFRYRQESNAEAFGQNEIETEDMQLQRMKRKPLMNPSRNQRRVLDRQRLLQAEVKLWPINMRNMIDRIH
ncbi:putative mediator of RNA polymerase II transcription subunit 12 [Drosophila pseudoobscura]|uniref:Mediator of RNA polymerase II transcription subunit 12 n=1 Tax=Drosophila pseudoobscura pseudoobscura TaxID=46245 RepID=A0A6I8V0E0_DROPS|nr:putative mediator of RNA polymerase II transcription subunit 12 [Drosophila pseudoobscura]